MIRFALIFAVFCSMSMADTLQLRDGSSVGGSWLGADAQKVRFLVNDQVQNYNRSDVLTVTFGDTAPVSTGPSTPPPPPPPPASRIESTMEGVRFTMERCERNGTESLRCPFTVEALKTDIDFQLWDNSFIVDSHGIQQRAAQLTVGSSHSSNGSARTLLVQDVPTRGELLLSGVDPQVNRIALASFNWYKQGVGSIQTVLRNIPISGN